MSGGCAGSSATTRPRRAAAHGARRRLPLHGALGMGVLTLRARLVLVLAYVLVLAIGSMLVPLVRSRARPDRGRGEAAGVSQAEVVAATAAGTADLDQLAATSAREVRGRVLIVDQRRDRAWRTARRGASGAGLLDAAEIAAALSGEIAAGPARQRDARPGDPGHGGADRARRRAGRRGPDHAERRRRRARRVAATIGLVLVGLIVLGAGLGGGRVAGRQRGEAAAAARGCGAAGGRGRPVGARADRGLAASSARSAARSTR